MLRKDFKVEVPIYYNTRQVEVQEIAKDNNSDPVTGYVRISHQVYNVKEEYERLRDAVNKLVAEGFTSAELRQLRRFGNIMPSLVTCASTCAGQQLGLVVASTGLAVCRCTKDWGP
ncbi:Isopenicillin N epimerase [Hordeum vulgare]|nr:Isopenicillin N epimerase [Hordeum vulgare]